MKVGEEWVYRYRDADESVPVIVVAIGSQKKPRVKVRFPSSDDANAIQDVPSGRLRCLWTEVSEYDTRMALWNRMRRDLLTDVEQAAAELVFELVIPEAVAECEWSPVRYSTLVRDEDALSSLLAVDLVTLTDGFETSDESEGKRFPPAATLVIAEAAARAGSEVVLKHVEKEEREARHRVKNGRESVSLEGDPYTTSPEWEYRMYLTEVRPLNELLRQWCGHRAVATYERLAAAEAEVFRLDQVIASLIAEADRLGFSKQIDWIVRDLEDDRITPYNVRVDIARPLRPDEIPVRIEYKRRWGGYR